MSWSARQFAKALKRGRRAAVAMHRRSRDPRTRGQNELLLDRDLDRLRDWQAWLNSARRSPASVSTASPVCGAWQLQFVVRNFAPAAAKVAVELREADGSWRELASRHAIEFRASAARRTARIRREFTVPVPARDSILRLRVDGVGQLGISQVVLTDGCTALTVPRFRRGLVLGNLPPAHGLPDPRAQGNPVELAFT